MGNRITLFLCSEPTVWDGDTGLFLLAFFLAIGSEPAVWDGDFSEKFTALPPSKAVPSPQCGMATKFHNQQGEA